MITFSTNDIRFPAHIVHNETLLEIQKKMLADVPQGPESASCHSLVEILDGAIMLYNISAHKQLAKVALGGGKIPLSKGGVHVYAPQQGQITRFL